jgi:CxxC motif-containing protein (DUF1111 family)
MRPSLVLMLALVCGACHARSSAGDDARSGGSASVFDTTRDAFGQPSAWLTEPNRRRFFVGNSFFNSNWLAAPASVADRDGLGPLFNARSCSGCHFKDGRGQPPAAGAPLSSMLLRISLPGGGPNGAPVGDPVYGEQIQGSALPGILPEADVLVEYTEEPGAFGDGERYSLRRPHYRLEHWGYGALPPTLLLSARVAPAISGLGLLEAVPEAELVRLTDPNDRDGDGVSGRQNQVLDVASGALVPGRFGWKAEAPSVRQQCASAFQGDLGLTSSLFPRENHSEREAACRDAPSGGSPEVSDAILSAVVLYARSLAVPARRDVTNAGVVQGAGLFSAVGCARCHVETLKTAPLPDFPDVPSETIHPYSDLLLHDLGPGLADDRPTFAASGSEWRTPPLWGLGLVKKVNGHTYLLHDGRARNASEAILWHDGEGAAARAKFVALTRSDRAALLAFLESL